MSGLTCLGELFGFGVVFGVNVAVKSSSVPSFLLACFPSYIFQDMRCVACRNLSTSEVALFEAAELRPRVGESAYALTEVNLWPCLRFGFGDCEARVNIESEASRNICYDLPYLASQQPRFGNIEA